MAKMTNHQTIFNQPVFFRGAAWAGIFILSMLIISVGREGLAALFAIQARHESSRWLKNPGAISFGLWEKANDNLATALALDPGNPFFHEDIGRRLGCGNPACAPPGGCAGPLGAGGAVGYCLCGLGGLGALAGGSEAGS